MLLYWLHLFIFFHFQKNRLKQERAELVKSKEKLQAKLEKYKIYHKYMEKALEAGEEFHEMRDIIARHDTLVATHEVKWLKRIQNVVNSTVQDPLITKIKLLNGIYQD